MSRDALVAAGEEIHGGVPLCAPWFGRGRDDVEVARPHGLVRWVPWRLVDALQNDDGSTSMRWELSGTGTSFLPGAADYPPDIQYCYEVRFADTLTLSLTVGSPSSSFILDEAFHTYFSISHINDVIIEGLDDTRYRDGDGWHPATGELRITGHTDRIYDTAADVTITDADRVLGLHTSGGANTVIWNPGPPGEQSLTGWDVEEWTDMVCVEVGNVQHNAVTVPAGGSHTLSLEISSQLLS